MKIRRLDHLVLTTAHFEECVRFYTEVLGMELIEGKGRYALRFGKQKINIHRKKAEFLPAAKHPTYGALDVCLIAEGDIEEIKAELTDKGCPIEEGVVSRTGALGAIRSVYVRDPDGNLVEISVYENGTL